MTQPQPRSGLCWPAHKHASEHAALTEYQPWRPAQDSDPHIVSWSHAEVCIGLRGFASIACCRARYRPRDGNRFTRACAATGIQHCTKVADVAGKGLGVVAVRGIFRGELLSAESPLITWSDDVDAPPWREAVQQQFQMLAVDQQERVISLCDCTAVEGRAKTLEGIVATNSFGVQSRNADAVVCETAARFNHSCRPNCEFSWDEDELKLHVFASADVDSGCELCVS
eukprot:TRINITY_DN27138_c0_g1_i1.p1 TRINITY_DN27138_c0_g1~~TRINITY_DN27138_c0_g1_i1.p1  ORF type:complete len:227 (-),score=20.81 TRINITY_DN27138_c0_g1_i1:403-1083(-)